MREMQRPGFGSSRGRTKLESARGRSVRAECPKTLSQQCWLARWHFSHRKKFLFFHFFKKEFWISDISAFQREIWMFWIVQPLLHCHLLWWININMLKTCPYIVTVQMIYFISIWTEDKQSFHIHIHCIHIIEIFFKKGNSEFIFHWWLARFLDEFLCFEKLYATKTYVHKNMRK